MRFGYITPEEIVEFLSPGGEAELPYEDTVTPGTIAQYWRGDKTWQLLNAAAVAFTPTGQIAAITVQLALAELDTEKAPLASPALTGTPTAPTAAAGTNTTQIATTAYVRTEVANLVAAAPTTLDTLDELAAALGDDPNFATTITTLIGTKQAGHANLTAFSGLTGAANKLGYFTGASTMALTDLTAAGRTLIGAADAAAQRSALGVVIGTNVQAWDADLDAVASSGIATAWTNYTPTLTAGAGSFTTTSIVAARYKQVGKTVFVRITILITTNGTANSFFTITAPVATPNIAAGAFQAIYCTTTGAAGLAGRAALDNNSSTIFVTKYDGTYLGQDGLYVHLTGSYECI